MSGVKIAADSGGGSVELKGPTSTTSNAAISLKLPVADGSANQLLKTDGSGNLGWATDTGGKTLQVVSSVASESSGGLNTTTWADTDLSGSITPTKTGSKILVQVHQHFSLSNGTNNYFGVKLVRDSTDIWLPVEDGSGPWSIGFAFVTLWYDYHTILYLDTHGVSAGTSITYKTMFKNQYSPGPTVTFNPTSTNDAQSTILMTELDI